MPPTRAVSSLGSSWTAYFRYPPLLACPLGLAAVVYGTVQAWQAWESSSWPRAEAVVTSAQLSQRGGAEGGPEPNRNTYSAEIGYEFHVDGVRYTGNRMRFGKVRVSAASAWRTVHDYRTGTRHPVSYDPDDPTRNVLQPGLQWSTLLLPAFGLLLVAVGWGTFLLFGRLGGRTEGRGRTRDENGLVTEPGLDSRRSPRSDR